MRFLKKELFPIKVTLTLWCSVVSARKRPAPEFSRHTVIKPHIYHGREKREITSTRDEDVSTGLQRIYVLLGCPEHWNIYLIVSFLARKFSEKLQTSVLYVFPVTCHIG